MLRIKGPIDSEHAVQVVDFMLQKFGESAFRPDPFPLSEFVEESDIDGIIPLNVGENVRERKTIIPESEALSALPDDSGIDQRTGIFKVDIDDFLRRADLRRSDASAKAATRICTLRAYR